MEVHFGVHEIDAARDSVLWEWGLQFRGEVAFDRTALGSSGLPNRGCRNVWIAKCNCETISACNRRCLDTATTRYATYKE